MNAQRPPGIVLQLATARGMNPGLALSRRVEQGLERTEVALANLVEGKALFTRRGGRLAQKVMTTREVLFRAQARLREASGEGAIPAPLKAETVVAIHEQVRQWLAKADRSLKSLPEDVLPPARSAIIRTLRPR